MTSAASETERHAPQHLSRGRRWRVLGPAYFTMAVRWGAWLMALAIVLLHGAPRYDLGREAPFLLLTAAQNGLFTAHYPLLHRRLRRWRRLLRARHVDGRVWFAVVDFLLAQVALAATGGFHSPFLVYSLTTLMFPAIEFGTRGALLAATAYALCRLTVVALAPGGLAGVAQVGEVDSLISSLVNAFLIALFSAYLAGLLRREAAARRRAVQAAADTRALYAVAQAILESPPEPDALYARALDSARHHLQLARIGMYALLGGKPYLSVGYGLPPAHGGLPADCSYAALVVDGEMLGWLAGAGRRGAEPRVEAALRALAAQLALGLRNARLMAEKQELAAVGERERLAREIHDGVAQSLYMLTLNLEACVELAERENGLRPRLEQLLGLARQALWEVRHYIFDLKPLLGDDAPLETLLRNPLREFQTIAQLPAELQSHGAERPLPPRARAAVYRVLQEALANAFKHAAASRVDVDLAWEPDGLQLTVRDDGQGFDPTTVRRGHGLDNLAQRAAEVGGSASVVSWPGQGTRVELRVPYAGAADAADALPETANIAPAAPSGATAPPAHT